MAVARLNKLRILVHKSQTEELIDSLQEAGALEVIDLKSRLAEDEYSVFFKGLPPDERAGAPDEALGEILWLIDFMAIADKKKRYTLKKEEFQEIAKSFDYQPIFKIAKEMEFALKQLETPKKVLSEEVSRFLPWRDLGIDLEELSKDGYVIKGLASIKEEPFSALDEGLKELNLDVYIESVSRSDNTVYIFFAYLKEDDEKVVHVFKKYGLEHIYFPEYKGKPDELLALAEDTLGTIDIKKKGLYDTISRLAGHKKEAMVLFDYLSNLARKNEASRKFLSTEEVYLVEGWVKRSSAKALKEKVETKFSEAALSLSEPAPGDDVPIILENWRFFQPFELITKIYGMPAYNEVDPTPFLAPFFFLFFGFCITDAAYGVILILLSFWALKKFRMGWMGNRFLRLLLYGGFSTLILGAMTGGWFGNAIDMIVENNRSLIFLKQVKDSIILLDPMEDPMKLLVVALTLGFAQIWFGHIVAIYGNVKNKRYLDALMDQGSILIFLFGFTGLVLGILGAIPKSVSSLFVIFTVAGSLLIVLTAGRNYPSIGSKIFYGIFTLYNAFSGYLSDLLSYSRLWALGLVTGVMAATSNMMAVIIGNMVPYIGFIVTVLILVGGHLLTLAMSLLGAFIHPIRLQFVEFFSKFFRGGGRSFEPLRFENKYVMIE
ncbi:MAG: V-type ATP synthase subunit I [Candidatus Omnitrophica bacterium]|nr:V-type ATP synthase subunit I [Candidatus Omnitrophota bacterium]